MIPRAKYVQKSDANNSNNNSHIMQSGVATATQGAATLFTTTSSVGGSTPEAKLLSYLDASPSNSKVIPTNIFLSNSMFVTSVIIAYLLKILFSFT